MDQENNQSQYLPNPNLEEGDNASLIENASLGDFDLNQSRLENKFNSKPRWLDSQNVDITAEISQEYDEWTARHGCTPAVRKCAKEYLEREYPVCNEAGAVMEAIPTTEGMALWLSKRIGFEVDSRTIKKWFTNNVNDFSRLQAKKRDIQVVTLSSGGLSGRFERSLSRVLLARQGIRDVTTEGVILQVVDKFKEDI